jgi:hypothetical protein
MESSNSMISVTDIMKKIRTRPEMEDFFKSFGKEYN